ncbi:MAG: hypothetical protein WCH79_07610 [Planctomycetia bacterium]
MTRPHTTSASFPVRFGRVLLASVVGLLGTGWGGLWDAEAFAQTIVYRPVATGFAPAAGPYVANYNPAGNYAAVSAFSPPVVNTAPMAVISMPLTAVVPGSSMAVTSYSVPAMTTVARPVTAYYAPFYAAAAPTVAAYAPNAEFFSAVSGPVAVTSYYAPSSAPAYAPTAVMAPVAMAPTVQMMPTAVAIPLYRRGPFGGLRPVRGAYWPAY